MSKPTNAKKPDTSLMDNVLKTTLQTSDGDKGRNRVRMELTPKRAEWLLGLIQEEIRGMDIDSPDFASTFSLYNSIKTQLANLTKKI